MSCARLIAKRESGFNPYAGSGLYGLRLNATHHGLFQLHDGFYGSLAAAAQARGIAPSWWNPWLNAAAAAQGFAAYGSFRPNWGTPPPGCP